LTFEYYIKLSIILNFLYNVGIDIIRFIDSQLEKRYIRVTDSRVTA